jgi:lysozyme
MRRIPDAAFVLVRRHETLHDPVPATARLYEPYYDPVGFPTIGYGHLLSREPWSPLGRWSSITETEADALLERDMALAARSVLRLIGVPLTDGQFAALADFTFNVGAGNLELSTLRRVINRGDYPEAPNQFRRWIFARGVKLPGLVRRRNDEIGLWLGAGAGSLENGPFDP